MTSNRSVVLVGNPSSLSSGLLAKFRMSGYLCFLYSVDKDLGVWELFHSFLEQISLIDSISCVVYVSGETRDSMHMLKLNYHFPRLILDYTRSSISCPFLYLSSLSVFGLPSSSIMTVDSSRRPYSLYGITKNYLDCYVLSLGLGPYIIAIMPGSIINPLSSHGLFRKLQNFLKEPPWSLFSCLLAPSGYLQCVHIADLIDHIELSVQAMLVRPSLTAHPRFLVSSTSIPFSTIIRHLGRSPLVCLRPVPLTLLCRLLFFLPPAVRQKIAFLLSDVCYVSEFTYANTLDVSGLLSDVR